MDMSIEELTAEQKRLTEKIDKVNRKQKELRESIQEVQCKIMETLFKDEVKRRHNNGE